MSVAKQFNRAGVPAELLETPQWVCWRWEERAGKRTKVPMNAETGFNGSSTDPRTWSSSEAAERSPYGDGIGFVVTPRDAYAGIDIDHCVASSGEIDRWAKSVVTRFDSYTETTPSGDGLRVWVKAKLPTPSGKSKNLERGMKIEFYDHARFFTVTGRHLEGTPTAIFDRQDVMNAAFAKLFPPPPPPAPRIANDLSLSDLDLVARAQAAANGDDFSRLWSGDASAYGSRSEADMALLCHLAFWSARDPAQMDRLFRQSRLMREKWDRGNGDYARRSVAKAIELTTEVYTPGVPVRRQERQQVIAVTPESTGLFRVRDIAEEIRDYYHHGLQRGDHPGWQSLSNLYRIGRREWTIVTGSPTSGKSAFLDALMLNLVNNGWKFVVCSPENQPLRRHFAHLSAILTNQPFYGPERMDESALEWAINFLDEHILFNMPANPSLDAVLDNADEAIRDFGATGVVIDPWNRIERAKPKNVSDTDFVGDCLARITNWIRARDAHLWLVAHPTKMTKERRFNPDGSPMMKDGRVLMDYPPATLYDISGSANFFNMADNGISVYRDKHGERNLAQIHVLKVKFYENGKPGVAELRWDTASRRFEDTGFWWEDGTDRPATPPPDSSAPPVATAPAPNYTDPDALADARSGQMGLDDANAALADAEDGPTWGGLNESVNAMLGIPEREDDGEPAGGWF